MGLSFLHLFVLSRRHSHDFTEKSGEVIAVFDAYLITNLAYFHVREVQQLACLLYLQLVEIGQNGVAGTLVEKGGEVRSRVTYMVGYLLQGKSFLYIFFHKMDGGGHYVLFVILPAYGIAVGLQIAQRTEVMAEHGTGIKQIFVAVSHFERMEYFFKHFDAIADARMDARADFNRKSGWRNEMRCQFSFEVNPVNGPWIFFVCSVGVRFSGR